MPGPTSPITYILPDEGWAPLLEIIVREADRRRGYRSQYGGDGDPG